MPPSYYDSLIAYLHTPWAIALTAGTASMLIALAFAMHMRKTSDMRKINKIISKYGLACEKNAVLSDDMDGFLFADYLLLLPSKIIIIKYVDNTGYIFGTEKIDIWTCVENNKTGKFKNPLDKINLLAQQIKRTTQFDAVEAYALFGSNCNFPKGMPEAVLQIASLDERLQKDSQDKHQENTLKAWDILISMVSNDRATLSSDLQP